MYCRLHPIQPLSHRIVSSILLVASLSGCARDTDTDTETGDWQAVTETVGNITTVRTISGSVWGEGMRLVEEASIGVSEGEDPYILGDISGMAMSGDKIYVLDWSVPVLRMYDLEGQHIKDIGRAGSGPGEFRMPWSLSADPANGRIYVRDDGQMRINVYSTNGDILGHIQLSFGLMTTDPMVISSESNVYTPILIRGSSGSQDAMAAYSLNGAVGDTIVAPALDYEPPTLEYLDDEGETFSTAVPFTPEALWVLTPNLEIVSGIANEYRLEIRNLDGEVTVIERTIEPVSMHPEEKDWYRRRLIASIHRTDPGWRWRGTPIPDAKPFFDAVVPDRNNRIWLLRRGEGFYLEGCNEEAEAYPEFRNNPCWRDSYFFDVFETTGRFLGSVQAPDGIRTYPEPFFQMK